MNKSNLKTNKDTKKCKYCESDILLEAKTCPKCSSKQSVRIVEAIAVILEIILVVSVLLSLSDSKKVTPTDNQLESIPISVNGN